MSLTAISSSTAWSRTNGLIFLAACAAALSCAEPVGPAGPQVTIALLGDLSDESVLVEAEAPGRLAVTARIRFACPSHPLVPTVQRSGATLTLTVERRWPDFTLCRISEANDRSYRADLTAVPSGTWTLHVVHTYPQALAPPPPDTVFSGSIAVP